MELKVITHDGTCLVVHVPYTWFDETPEGSFLGAVRSVQASYAASSEMQQTADYTLRQSKHPTNADSGKDEE